MSVDVEALERNIRRRIEAAQAGASVGQQTAGPRSCGASTPSGRKAPVNRDGTSHFATCPQAADWRRRAG